MPLIKEVVKKKTYFTGINHYLNIDDTEGGSFEDVKKIMILILEIAYSNSVL